MTLEQEIEQITIEYYDFRDQVRGSGCDDQIALVESFMIKKLAQIQQRLRKLEKQ